MLAPCSSLVCPEVLVAYIILEHQKTQSTIICTENSLDDISEVFVPIQGVGIKEGPGAVTTNVGDNHLVWRLLLPAAAGLSSAGACAPSSCITSIGTLHLPWCVASPLTPLQMLAHSGQATSVEILALATAAFGSLPPPRRHRQDSRRTFHHGNARLSSLSAMAMV